MTNGGGVCVMIAAKDAAATIGRAVRSALAEPEVAEVVVVDDGSADDTAAAARARDDGSDRLRIERLPVNRGPSAARNHALSLARAPFVAVLDADDMVLPGRFARLLAIPDWDVVADNIVFVPEQGFDGIDSVAIPSVVERVSTLDLARLVAGSTGRYARKRTQLGFLKPVIRMEALRARGLHYDEDLRLGEDFVLYAEILAGGARFRLTTAVGYLAVERSTSLTARHACDDLAALLAAERALAARIDAPTARRALKRRIADTRYKWALRAFLRAKRERGLQAALADLGGRPADWYGVAEGIALDKVRAALHVLRPAVPDTAPRLLLS